VPSPFLWSNYPIETNPVPEKSPSQKMFLKAGKSLAVIKPPDDWQELLGEVPADIVSLKHRKSTADTVLLFVRSQSELVAQLPLAKSRMTDGGALWVAYVKGSSKQAGAVHRDSIRTHAATIGLEAVSIIAINADWACLRLKQA
jgi:hypothetical protein